MSQELSNEVSCNYKKGYWTKEEDTLLIELIDKYSDKKWKYISNQIKTRSPLQCLQRWTKILKPGLVKGPWTEKENNILKTHVNKNGPTNWSICSQLIPGRSSKQCREHWLFSLNPNINKGEWTKEEEFQIFYYYRKLNGGWKAISNYLNSRTPN